MEEKKTIVISLGGSVILSKDLDHDFFKGLKIFIDELIKSYKVYLIIGGGTTARTYIKLGRKQKFSEENLDWIGINSTRLNAMFLSILLTNEIKQIPETIDQALRIIDPLVIMGGTTPGHSTDYVGAELAAAKNAMVFIIATNVDGVYDKDPNKHKDARFLKEISIDSLLAQHGNSWDSAGKNTVIDGPALQKIKDHQIPTMVVNGQKIKEMKNIINKTSFHGTKILH